MEQVRLHNPKSGADILSNFVHVDDELKRPDQKTKELKVTNSKKVTFPKDSYIKTDRKTADWILKTWGFITEVSSEEVASKDPVVDSDELEAPKSKDIEPEVLGEPKDVETSETDTGEDSEDAELTEDEILQRMKDDFAELEEIGWAKLKGEKKGDSGLNRDNYKLLKTQLEELQ